MTDQVDNQEILRHLAALRDADVSLATCATVDMAMPLVIGFGIPVVMLVSLLGLALGHYTWPIVVVGCALLAAPYLKTASKKNATTRSKTEAVRVELIDTVRTSVRWDMVGMLLEHASRVGEKGPYLTDPERTALQWAIESGTAEDYARLTPALASKLSVFLTPMDAQTYPGVVRAIVRAIAPTADEEAVNRLRNLAHPPMYNLTPNAVLNVVRECLPAIEERLHQTLLARTLLRPSSNPAEPGDMLLRPVESRGTEPVQQLLRPTNDGET